MRQLSGLAHEYTAMGVLGPIQLIGRRRVEYPLVQDTVTIVCLSYRFCSAPLIALLVEGEVEDCSMLEHGFWDITISLI